MAQVDPDVFPINQLPDEILLEIFLQREGIGLGRNGDFPYREFPYRRQHLLPPIASVCSRWRRLYFQPQMWRSKVIDVRGSLTQLRPDSHFFAVLNRMAGEIHKLRISADSSFGHRLLPMLPTFPAVEQLIFDISLPADDHEVLVEKFPAVQSVKFDLSANLDDALLLQMGSGWENLRKIDISKHRGCHDVTGTGLIRFAQLANHIESLNISSFHNLTDGDFDDVTTAIGVGLKSVTFGYTYRGTRTNLSELAIESLVLNCPSIEQICIRKPLPVGRLKDLVQLKHLKLKFYSESCKYPDVQGFEELFSRPLCQLRSFKAKGVNNLTDSLLELIADSCPQLECLSLLTTVGPDPTVTDSGLAHIVNKCRNLRVLFLWGFPLLIGRSFIGAGAKLPNLSRLELYACKNIDAEMVRRAFVRSTRLQIKSDLDGPWDLRRF